MATRANGPEPGRGCVDGSEARTTDRGDQVSVGVLREYLIWAIHHDAVYDKANDLIFDHAVAGRLHPTVAAASLRELVKETISAATDEDWQAVFNTLASEARESVPELGSRSPDSSGLRKLRDALRRLRGWRKGTL